MYKRQVHNSDNADMRSNETFTYREAVYAMLLRNANEAAMGPVSYTHLDVYKRQVYFLSPISSRNVAFSGSV